MTDGRQDERAGKIHQSGTTDGELLNPKDLTCQEAQIEERLSKRESTKGETDEKQDDSIAARKPTQ